jgi:hypothetical protein
VRVFISSTTDGLGSYRQFAADVLSDWHDIEPVFQEKLTANHKPALDYLTRLIISCDKVICLIGPFLGSCPPDQLSKYRRSYTQMEYDVARQNGLPLYVFDGRRCELDGGRQTDEDRRLQDVFWKDLESFEQRLYPAFRDKAHLSQLLLRLIRDWHDATEPWQNLPTPLVHWHRRMHKRALVLSDLREALDFATSLAAANAAYLQPISAVVDAKTLLHQAGQDPFIQGLSYEAFANYCDWEQQMRMRRAPPSKSEIEERFKAVLDLLQALEPYLLVHVSRQVGGLILTVHHGPLPQRTHFFDPANGEVEAIQDDAIYLLDLHRKLSLRLSPHLQSLPGKPDVLCLWWREAESTTTELVPLTASQDSKPAPERNWSLPARSPLLTNQSWNALIRQYPPAGRRPGEYCGEWRLLGSTGQSRNLVEIFLATDDGTRDQPAGLWRARDQIKKDALQHVADQFRLWLEIDKDHSPWFAPVHHFEFEPQPTIVAAIPAGMRPLARFLASDRSRLELGVPLRQLVSGVVQICLQLGRHGVRLLHCSPADLYWDGQEQCQLVGVGATVAEGMTVPNDRALWDVLSGDEQPVVAPELLDGAGVSQATEMYALGILLQRCRHRSALSPMPAGDKRDVQDANMRDVWRQDPWECLLFHCLAREAGRRFVSWEQFLTYFDRCSSSDARARLTRPETVPLIDGLSISACPISHFQYERFCDDRGQPAPSGSLAWKYAAPFAPVVGVSIGDCEAYCKWLDTQFGGRWRLPTAAEWSAAAGDAGYPWGPEAPEAMAANYGGTYRGPTVVGGFPCGERSGNLRDLAGNVWEWCVDLAPDGPCRILKGGSFASPGSDLLVSKEDHRIAGGRYIDVGFRVIHEEVN